jgi:hypothetical protein
MKHTPGPWQVHTSNSWRRIYSRDHGSVCEPVVQNDGHPDLFFKNGGPEGHDAKLIEAAPDLLEALKTLYEENADYIRLNHLGDVHHNRSMQLARDALAKAGLPSQVNEPK